MNEATGLLLGDPGSGRSPSPAASGPGPPSAPPPGGPGSASWSWAARPVRPGRRRPRPGRRGRRPAASSTAGRAASRPSGSSSRSRWPTSSSGASSTPWPPSAGDLLDPATRVGPLARADLLDALSARSLVGRGAKVLSAAPAWTGPAGGTPRRSWPASPRTCRCSPRRPSARSRPSSAPPTPRPRSSWPTTPPTGSGPASGPATWSGPAPGWARIESGSLFVNAVVASDPRLFVGDQAQRLRPRAGRGRHPGVHQHPHLRPARRRAPPATLTE